MNNSQKGVALYIAFMIMTVLLVIAFGISTILFGELRVIKGMGNSVIAFYAADTGIEQMLYDPQPSHSGSIGAAPYNASYQVTMVCSPSHPECPTADGFFVDNDCSALNYCIESTGIYKETRRAIRVTR